MSRKASAIFSNLKDLRQFVYTPFHLVSIVIIVIVIVFLIMRNSNCSVHEISFSFTVVFLFLLYLFALSLFPWHRVDCYWCCCRWWIRWKNGERFVGWWRVWNCFHRPSEFGNERKFFLLLFLSIIFWFACWASFIFASRRVWCQFL